MAELARQAHQRRLGCGIGLDTGQADGQPGAAGDVDDTSGARCLHAGCNRLAQVERAAHIDRKDGIPLLWGHGLQRAADLSQHAASVVDQDVHLWAGLADLLHQRLDSLGLGDIHDPAVTLTTTVTAQVFRVGQFVGHDIDCPDCRAVACQRLTDRAAKTMRCPGHDRGLAGEVELHAGVSRHGIGLHGRR